jgi:hypothetical protein
MNKMPLKINDKITLKGLVPADDIVGNLIGISVKPELLLNQSLIDSLQLPEDSQGVYLSKQIAGIVEITVKVVITTANADSPILSNIIGIDTYEVEGESYIIKKVDSGNDLADNISIITLIKNQQSSVDPTSPIEPSKEILAVLDQSKHGHVYGNLVKGRSVRLLSDTEDTYKIVFQVYKYSDDDELTTDVVNDTDQINTPTGLKTVFGIVGGNNEGGVFIFSQEYEKDSETMHEVWETEGYISVKKLPSSYMDSSGVTSNVIEYTLKPYLYDNGEIGGIIYRRLIGAPPPTPITIGQFCAVNNGNTTEVECTASGSDYTWVPEHDGVPAFCAMSSGFIDEASCEAEPGYDWKPGHSGIPGFCAKTASSSLCNGNPATNRNFIWIPSHGTTPGFCTYAAEDVDEATCISASLLRWVEPHDGIPGFCVSPVNISSNSTETECNDAGPPHKWIPSHGTTPGFCTYTGSHNNTTEAECTGLIYIPEHEGIDDQATVIPTAPNPHGSGQKGRCCAGNCQDGYTLDQCNKVGGVFEYNPSEPLGFCLTSFAWMAGDGLVITEAACTLRGGYSWSQL